jgi:8-oxo-dGTP pyrophosphatase MutT (NUDIX family)
MTLAVDALRTRVRTALHGSRPGDESRLSLGGLSLSETLQHLHLVPERLTPAAVLIPILDRPEGLSVLLTQRSAELKHHAGQVSFPGGRCEATDLDPADTALREAEEEIGLARERVEILGYLGDHLILTGYRVTPVVALVRPEGDLRIDQSEVDSVFELPLDKALDARRYHARHWSMGGEHVRFFDLYHANRRIWGATAGMLASLARVLGLWTDPA